METPGESKWSQSTRETTQGKIQHPLLLYTRIKKRSVTRGAAHVKKSSSTRWNVKLQSVYRLISSTQIIFWMMAILPKRDKAQRKKDEEWVHVPLYCSCRGKLPSSVTHLESLIHYGRHTFSVISRMSRRSTLGIKQRWRLQPWSIIPGMSLCICVNMHIQHYSRSCYLKTTPLQKVQRSEHAHAHTLTLVCSARCSRLLQQQYMRQALPYVAAFTHMHVPNHENTHSCHHILLLRTLKTSHKPLHHVRLSIDWERVTVTVFIWMHRCLTGL